MQAIYLKTFLTIQITIDYFRKKTLDEQLESIKQKREKKTADLSEITSALSQQAASEYTNDQNAKLT